MCKYWLRLDHLPIPQLITLSCGEWDILWAQANQTLLFELGIQLTPSKPNSIKMQNVNYLHEKTHCCFLSATVLPSSSFYQRVFLLSSFVHSFLPSFLPPPSFCYVFLSFSASGLLAKFTTYIPASLSLIPSFTLVISCFNCISEILVINQGRELTNRQIFIKHRVDPS